MFTGHFIGELSKQQVVEMVLDELQKAFLMGKEIHIEISTGDDNEEKRPADAMPAVGMS